VTADDTEELVDVLVGMADQQERKVDDVRVLVVYKHAKEEQDSPALVVTGIVTLDCNNTWHGLVAVQGSKGATDALDVGVGIPLDRVVEGIQEGLVAWTAVDKDTENVLI
jgi:hypothetical protein